MNRITSARFFATTAVALGAFVVASAVHARSDVHFSVGVHAPAPAYVAPPPVYVRPAPVYVPPPPAYVAPRPVYVQPEPSYHGGYGGYGHERRWARRYGPYGDFDRDGIMNMDDRDRDGDGIRNRHDRFPMDPYRY